MRQIVKQALQREQKRLTKVAKKKFGNTAWASTHVSYFQLHETHSTHVWLDGDIIHTQYAELTTKQLINWIKSL